MIASVRIFSFLTFVFGSLIYIYIYIPNQDSAARSGWRHAGWQQPSRSKARLLRDNETFTSPHTKKKKKKGFSPSHRDEAAMVARLDQI